ncbi:MAG: hypothetical protein R2712_19960 [Vicinamibacterales bacterium]
MTLVGVAAPAAAQGPGVRGGVSVDPDQVYFGGHYETSELIDRLHFRPNLELGLGDDVVTTAVNMEFIYKFPTRTDWQLYAGGGPAVNFYSFDDSIGGGTETEGGLNLIFGAEQRNGLFFEVKVGAIDSPDVKFGVGWTFR